MISLFDSPSLNLEALDSHGTVPLTAEASGSVYDGDLGAAENYKNQPVVITVLITSGGINDVLKSGDALRVIVSGHGKTWSSFTANLDAGYGETTYSKADYGSLIKANGIVSDVMGTVDIYWILVVPTTAGGELVQGSTLILKLYLSDPNTTHDFWDEGDIIDLQLIGTEDALTLSGFDGAYLLGVSVNTGGDTDNDSMSDTWENQYGLDPNTNDASQDNDGDGWTNRAEYQIGTDPSLASSYPVGGKGPKADGEAEGAAEGIPTIYVAAGTVAIVVISLALALHRRLRGKTEETELKNWFE
jgi:hypothetical protein